MLYICGSDEHGVSILISSKKEGVSPQEIIDRYAPLEAAIEEPLLVGDF